MNPLYKGLPRRDYPGTGTLPAGRDPLRPASRRGRIVRIAIIALGVAAVCAYLERFTQVFDYFEQKAQGERLRVYARRHGSLASWARKRIVLVTLSDDSFDPANPERLTCPEPPVPRAYHARIIRELTRAGARVIAFDFSFAGSRPGDAALAKAARESGRVLWACSSDRDALLLPNAALRRASPRYGHTRVPPLDTERPALDRLEPVVLERGASVPAFSLEVARTALGLGEQPLRRVSEGWRVGDLAIPLEPDGTFKIRYLGEPGTFPTIPYEQIYNGAVDDAMFRQSRFFRDKIVLIGDVTTKHHDFHLTPQGQMAGVEIHAHAVATFLRRRFFWEAPPWVSTALICGVAAAVCFLAARPRLGGTALCLALFAPAYLLLNLWLFVERDISLPVTAPAMTIALAALGSLFERGLTEEREKSWMRGLLQRYVSPQVAEYAVEHPERCVLGGAGERVIATVLFSDIRGFTPLSEQIAPEHLVARLNEYFQAMTDIVFRHHGAIRFIGDGFMALFGAPVPRPDHARQAVAAAIEMQTRLLGLQGQWQARGLPILDIGIGISTGEMVVGVVGARQHMELTVYGAPVNLASRMESLNKDLGTRILISDATYRCVEGDVAVRGPITMIVRGLEEAVAIYEVFGPRAETVGAPGDCSAAA